jgi:hypothetical protein
MLSFHFSPRAAQSRSALYLLFVLGFSLLQVMFSPDPAHGVPFPLPVMISFRSRCAPCTRFGVVAEFFGVSRPSFSFFLVLTSFVPASFFFPGKDSSGSCAEIFFLCCFGFHTCASSQFGIDFLRCLFSLLCQVPCPRFSVKTHFSLCLVAGFCFVPARKHLFLLRSRVARFSSGLPSRTQEHWLHILVRFLLGAHSFPVAFPACWSGSGSSFML